jgi:hypothetical protein
MKRKLFSGAIAAGCLALIGALTSTSSAADMVLPTQPSVDKVAVSTSIPVQTVGWRARAYRRGYYGGYYYAPYAYGTYSAPYNYGTYYRPNYYRSYYAPYRGYYRGWW